jgi:hypothetical protein
MILAADPGRGCKGSSPASPVRTVGTSRHRTGVLLGGLVLLSLGAPHPVQAQGTFTTASLQGTYAYVNNTAHVGSLGLITFDGAGELTAEIKVNLPDEMGGRTVVPTSGSGTWRVEVTPMDCDTREPTAEPGTALHTDVRGGAVLVAATPIAGRGPFVSSGQGIWERGGDSVCLDTL